MIQKNFCTFSAMRTKILRTFGDASDARGTALKLKAVPKYCSLPLSGVAYMHKSYSF
jgi:hypothetical protein